MFSKVVFFSCLLSLVLLVPLSISGPVVHGSRCYMQLNQDYPTNANPRQTIQVTTTMDISCAQWRTYYTGRADLVEVQSNAILSSTPFDVGWRPFVSATVTNVATAPQVNGPWALNLVVYIFEDGSIMDSLYRTFTIQVGTRNVSTSQTTSTVQTTTFESTNTPTQTIASFQTSVSQSLVTSPLTSEPIPIALGVLLAGLCAVGVAVVLRARKRNA